MQDHNEAYKEILDNNIVYARHKLYYATSHSERSLAKSELRKWLKTFRERFHIYHEDYTRHKFEN